MSRATKSRPSASSEQCCPASGKLRARATRQYSALFRALGDETRLEIIGLLAAQGKELCVCELESHFALSQPTISHHLRILREAGVVSAERRGTWVYYALDATLPARCASFLELFGN